MSEEAEELDFLKLGKFELRQPGQKENKRLAILLWGQAGCGKTSLAATMPGHKLWISFDDGATDALANRDDIHDLDVSGMPNSFVERFKEEDPLGLGRFFKENPKIESVVVDSCTTFGEKALFHGVQKAKTTLKGKKSTIEDPGFAGYGNKNTWMRAMVLNMLSITKAHGKHICFIAHEDVPEKSEEGIVLYITMMLGGKLTQQLGLQLGEVWWMNDAGKKRTIAVRNCRTRQPMKTRMFLAKDSPEFTLDFDADTLEGEGIADWYNAWKKGGYKKIPLPS